MCEKYGEDKEYKGKCSDYYNCCDCGVSPNDIDNDNGCGCRYCFSCNACDECINGDDEFY